MARRLFPILCLVLLSVSTTLSQDGGGDQQDNMCQKTVSESIPTRVSKRVSVSVRSTYKCGFLWLKTCSRYHTTYRMTYAIEYKIENRIIAVCCNGTDATGNCSVPKKSCAIPGRFGPDCASVCDCENNKTLAEICDDVTGYCFCKDGYRGPRCDDTDGFIPTSNNTDVTFLGKREPEVVGGGDVITRVVVALVVVLVVLTIVIVVFCCWRRRIRRKAMASGATVTDDIVVNILPETEASVQYVPAEEIRRRKRQEQRDVFEEDSGSKPYDYVEMRGLSGSRPALSAPSDEPAVTIKNSGSSISRKALEEDIAAGRISCAYANLSDHYAGPDPYTYHGAGDANESQKLPFAPTYSSPRRQESNDSAFDDDGYCTSPKHSPEEDESNPDGSEYSKPMYFVDKSGNQGDIDPAVENIYDLPSERIHPEAKPSVDLGDDNGYANSSIVLHSQTGDTGNGPHGQYDHLERDC